KLPTIHQRISRFTANGDVAALDSEVVIFEMDDLGPSTQHVGGGLRFGHDDKLYVSTGDNAAFPDYQNSQKLTNTFGKILRINSDGSIPTDNPFYNSTMGNYGAIWALGLRNPYTFAFQPGMDRMFINDVGGDLWEEINDGIAGSNYGWRFTEGYTSDPRFLSPIFAYPHGSGETAGCAITGGD